ncbi:MULTISPECIES: plantaricin C family lantibiotic [Bacillaceae]|uniref:Plantaricin C family lantibiotic n=1 Tax=Metabacillus sediminis TaxID=3117746 RepID=A0ABZ2NFR5_9BACI|nr:plantaricin C family lantibiotic [Bacillus sp. SJS]KZZ84924.1 hypothetical protein AS29_007670 [Bacillus sp. SJS]
MNKAAFLKNPVLRMKSSLSVENPAGNVLEEISAQDMMSQVGGTIITISLCATASKYLGNKGYVCTATKECQNSCQ